MPAQQMTPARGLEVDLIQVKVAERAEDIDGVEETSVEMKSVRAGSESSEDTEDCGGGLRSRMETFAFWESRRMVVARPRPLDYIHRILATIPKAIQNLDNAKRQPAPMTADCCRSCHSQRTLNGRTQ